MFGTTHFMAGGGGDVIGFRDAGFTPRAAANHNPNCILTLQENFGHLGLRTLYKDIERLLMSSLPESDVLVGSPVCTEVAPAGGNTARKLSRPRIRGQESLLEAFELERLAEAEAKEPMPLTRATAYSLTRATEVHHYKYIVGENVPEFVNRWPGFRGWVQDMIWRGYRFYMVSADAAHIAPDGGRPLAQQRARILFVFVREDMPTPNLEVRPECLCFRHGLVRGRQLFKSTMMPAGMDHINVGHYGDNYIYVCPETGCDLEVEPRTIGASSVIDWSVPGHLFGAGKGGRGREPYSDNTRHRVEVGLRKYEGKPFMVVARKNCFADSLDEPTNTITAQGNHHWLAVPDPTGLIENVRYRGLTVMEKQLLQGFPPGYRWPDAVKDTARKLLIGNANPTNLSTWAGQRIMEAMVS